MLAHVSAFRLKWVIKIEHVQTCCDLTFQTLGDYEIHWNEKHRDDNELRCFICHEANEGAIAKPACTEERGTQTKIMLFWNRFYFVTVTCVYILHSVERLVNKMSDNFSLITLYCC